MGQNLNGSRPTGTSSTSDKAVVAKTITTTLGSTGVGSKSPNSANSVCAKTQTSSANGTKGQSAQARDAATGGKREDAVAQASTPRVATSSPTLGTSQTRLGHSEPAKLAEAMKPGEPTQSNPSPQPAKTTEATRSARTAQSAQSAQSTQSTSTETQIPSKKTEGPETTRSTQPAGLPQSTQPTPTTQPVLVPANLIKPAQQTKPTPPTIAETARPAQPAKSAEISGLSQGVQSPHQTQTRNVSQPAQSTDPIHRVQATQTETEPSQTAQAEQKSEPPQAHQSTLVIPSALRPSLVPSSSSSVVSTDSSRDDDQVSNVSTSITLSETSGGRVEFQNQLKTLQTDIDCVKTKGDETELRIQSLEREIRGRLEKLETAVVKADRLEATLQRVEQLHTHFSLIQALEGKLTARVELIEKGLARMFPTAFSSPVSQGHDLAGAGQTESSAGSTNTNGQEPVDPAPPNDIINNPVSSCDPVMTNDSEIDPLNVDNPSDSDSQSELTDPELEYPPRGISPPLGLCGHSGELEIPDGSIEGLFTGLESKIQALVLKHFNYGVDQATAAGVDRNYWPCDFPSDDWENRKNSPKPAWFRGLVANLIHAELFSKPFFGCDDEAIEGGLAGFERLMARGTVDETHREEMTTWRTLTAKIMGRLFFQSQPKGSKKPEIYQRLAGKIMTVFSAVIKPSAPTLVAQLCSKAIECAFAVRKGRSTYLWLQTNQLQRASIAEIEICKRLRGTGASVGSDGYKVVFTVFGSVVKDDAEVEEDGKTFRDRIILRKASAVVA